MIKQLLSAIKEDQLEEVKKLLAQGPLINAVDETGMFPLLRAILNDRLAIARYLLEHGAHVTQVHPLGLTPLLRASATGSVDLVRLLLDYQAPTLPKVAYGPGQATPLSLALARQELTIVQILLTQPFDPLDEVYESHFTYLCRNRCLAFFQALVSCPDLKTRHPKLLSTTLIRAAQFGDIVLVDLMLKHGADINYRRPEDGQTALLAACGLGRMETVEHLCTQGADIELADSRKFSPLMVSLANLWPDIVEYLLKQGANPNTEAVGGICALALLEQSDRNAHRMLDKLNNSRCGPPLTLAKYHEMLALFVRQLLDSGAEFNYLARFEYDDTPAQKLIQSTRKLQYVGLDIEDIRSQLGAHINAIGREITEKNAEQPIDSFLRHYLGPDKEALLPHVRLRLGPIVHCFDKGLSLPMLKQNEAEDLKLMANQQISHSPKPEIKLESSTLGPTPQQAATLFKFQSSADPKSSLDTPAQTDSATHATEKFKNMKFA